MNDRWLTDQLKNEIRAVYEPKMNRKLSDEDIFEIANNLADFLELLLEFKFRKEFQNVQ